MLLPSTSIDRNPTLAFAHVNSRPWVMPLLMDRKRHSQKVQLDSYMGSKGHLQGWQQLRAAGNGCRKLRVDGRVGQDGQLPEQAASPLHPVDRLGATLHVT